MSSKQSLIGKTYDDYVTLRKTLLGSNIGLSIAIVLLTAYVFLKDDVVVMVPPNITEEAIIKNGKANEEYQTRFAYAYSLLIGNLKPSNAQFVLKSVEKIFSPSILDSIYNGIESEAQVMAKRNLSQKFDVIDMMYSETKDIVWVWGDRELTGQGADPITERRTYEYQIKPVNGRPKVVYFNSYRGMPEMKEVRSRGKKLETQYYTEDQLEIMGLEVTTVKEAKDDKEEEQ